MMARRVLDRASSHISCQGLRRRSAPTPRLALPSPFPPPRGKLLNVRDASAAQITGNAEIQNIKQILGLQHGKVYTDAKSLRYGHLMIMTDQVWGWGRLSVGARQGRDSQAGQGRNGVPSQTLQLPRLAAGTLPRSLPPSAHPRRAPSPCAHACSQDHDGSHIKGLIMNYFHHFYPSLLKLPGFLVEFITPIIKVRRRHPG